MGVETIKIGNQEWMLENLSVDTFQNGDKIKHAESIQAWVHAGQTKQPAWCYYDYRKQNGEILGKLYNWYAVSDPRGIAPSGFKIPTENEWNVLFMHMINSPDGLNSIKSTTGWFDYSREYEQCNNCANWNEEYRSKVPCHTCQDKRVVNSSKSYSGNGTNASGFSALPGGIRLEDGSFEGYGQASNWWSSTRYNGVEHLTHLAIGFPLQSDLKQLIWGNILYDMCAGLSVRCIADTTPQIEKLDPSKNNQKNFWERIFGKS